MDAHTLADMVRTDAHQLRAVAGDSDLAEGIKVLARAHKTLLWERTRHVLRLRQTLREYFPAALHAFDDLDSPEAVELLAKAPTPVAAARLPVTQIEAALRRARRRGITAKAAELRNVLRADHLRVAMAAAGWTANVNRFPDPNNLDYLASLDFSPMSVVTDGHRRRADAILHRRTDRLPYAAPRNWESFEPVLRDAVDAGTVHLDVIADEVRPQLARASQLTESLRLYDSSYHVELNWWTGHFENSDGIPRSSLVSSAESDQVDVGRTFPVSAHNERRPGFGQDQSTVLVLSTDKDTLDDAFRCGEALSAVLLEYTLASMATCTLTHLTELQSSRHLIGTLTGRAAMPQLLIRVGEAPVLGGVPPTTPRRPLRDVLTFLPAIPVAEP